MTSWANKDVLILSPAPVFPCSHGNRLRITRICDRLRAEGARLHFLLYPAEADWRQRLPVEALRQHTQAFHAFHLVPTTRPLHTGAAGSHHDIDEWWDPAIGQYLDWLCGRQHFDAAIINYTWLTHAFLHLPEGCLKILDTHDRFSGRKEMFLAQGMEPEFFYLTEAEEARALDRADVVWAIKREEADFFRTITARPVFSVPHIDPVRRLPAIPGTFLRVGMIGADNNLNRANFEAFLDAAEAHVARHLTNFELVIAGSVCKGLRPRDQGWIRHMGYVERAEDFYDAIDCVVVPMQFSTGLKIKTAEALAYGKPVLALAHAFEGFHPAHPWHSLDTHDAMLGAIAELARHPERLDELARASLRAAWASELEVRSGLSLSLGIEPPAAAPAFWIVLNAEECQAVSILADHAVEVADFLRHQLPVGFLFAGPGLPDDAFLARLSAIGRVLVLRDGQASPLPALPPRVYATDAAQIAASMRGAWVTTPHGAGLMRCLGSGHGFVALEALQLALSRQPGAQQGALRACLSSMGRGHILCTPDLAPWHLDLLAAQDWLAVLMPLLRGGWGARTLARLGALPPRPVTEQIAAPEGGAGRMGLQSIRRALAVIEAAAMTGMAQDYHLDPAAHPAFLSEVLLRAGARIATPAGQVLTHATFDEATRGDSGWSRIWTLVSDLAMRFETVGGQHGAPIGEGTLPHPAGAALPLQAGSGPTLGFSRLGPEETLSGRAVHVGQVLVYRPGGAGQEMLDILLMNLDLGWGAIQRLTLRLRPHDKGLTLWIRRNDCAPEAFGDAQSSWKSDEWGDFVVYELGHDLTPHQGALKGADARTLAQAMLVLDRLSGRIATRLGGELLDGWGRLAQALDALDPRALQALADQPA